MKIIFTGSRNTRRIVGPYTWRRENGHTVEVDDAKMCAELLTIANFAVAPDEPLSQIMQTYEIGELALFGLASIVELAALNHEGIIALARETSQDAKIIQVWVNQAKQLMEAQDGRQ